MSVDVPLDNIRIREFPTLNFSGGVAVDLDLDNIKLTELAPINIGLTQLPPVVLNAAVSLEKLPTVKLESKSSLDTDSRLESDSKVATESKVDLALDLRVRELPRLDIQFGARPMRFHFPFSYRFCLTLFGVTVLQFETCGEGMVVAEDYIPNASERCE